MKKTTDEFWDSSIIDGERRSHTVEKIKGRLESVARPRLMMTVMMILTWAAWFFSSVGMLRLGVSSMALRYPLSVGIAYLVFLGMLWIWLRGMVAVGASPEVLADETDIDPGIGMAAGALTGAAGLSATAADRRRRKSTSKGDGSFLSGGDFGVGEIDAGGCVLILGIALLLSALFVSGWMIATSPVLFAELVVDGLAMVAVSRSVSRSSAPHWTDSVVRRTWLPTLITAVVLSLIGFGLEHVAPGSATLAQAWRVTHQKPGPR